MAVEVVAITALADSDDCSLDAWYATVRNLGVEVSGYYGTG